MQNTNNITTAALTAQDVSALTSNTIYLMGMTFILGVLFTVFILLALDFMRRNAEDGEIQNIEENKDNS